MRSPLGIIRPGPQEQAAAAAAAEVKRVALAKSA